MITTRWAALRRLTHAAADKCFQPPPAHRSVGKSLKDISGTSRCGSAAGYGLARYRSCRRLRPRHWAQHRMAATAGLIERVVEPEGEGDTALRAFQVIEVSATAKNFDDRLDTAFSRALLETKKSLDRLTRGLALDDRRQRFLR